MSVNPELYTAIVRGEVEAVRSLLDQGCSATETDADGFTALMHAVLAESSREEIVAMLISAGADVNAKDKGQQWTPLAFAAREGKVAICKILLDSGSDIEAIDVFGNTPLWRAAMTNKPDVVRYLVQSGANLDHANRNGVTPRNILGPAA